MFFNSKCQKVWLREVTISWENIFQLKVSKSVITQSYDIMGERFSTQSVKKCDPEVRDQGLFGIRDCCITALHSNKSQSLGSGIVRDQGLLYNCSTPSSLLSGWDRSAIKHERIFNTVYSNTSTQGELVKHLDFMTNMISKCEIN